MLLGATEETSEARERVDDVCSGISTRSGLACVWRGVVHRVVVLADPFWMRKQTILYIFTHHVFDSLGPERATKSGPWMSPH